MRHVLAVRVVWLAGVASASAQVSERLDVGAIVRTDRVSFEGGQNARLPVTGVGVSYRVWRDMRHRRGSDAGVGRVETQLRRQISFRIAEPGATREEFRANGRHRKAHDDQQGGTRIRHGRRHRNAAAGQSQPRPSRGHQRPPVRLHRGHERFFASPKG